MYNYSKRGKMLIERAVCDKYYCHGYHPPYICEMPHNTNDRESNPNVNNHITKGIDIPLSKFSRRLFNRWFTDGASGVPAVYS